jgi:hypothetical protein
VSVQISIRKLDLKNGYMLEFIATDPYEIAAHLMKVMDPTMVDYETPTLCTQTFYRHANVDEDSGDVIEDSIETVSDFVRRTYTEARDWVEEEIAHHKEVEEVATAFNDFLDNDLSS